MKKKILAVVLAAATAFSMFGASLSASAASDVDLASYNYTYKTAATIVGDIISGAYDYVDVVDGKTYADYDKFIEEMEKVEAAIVEDTDEAIKTGKIYAYDYKDDKNWAAFVDAIDAALAADENDAEAYAAVYAALAAAVETAAGKLVEDKGNDYQISDLREELLDNFAANKKAFAALDKDDYELDADEDDIWDDLKAGFGFSPNNWANSSLLNHQNKYEVLVDGLYLADGEDLYDELADWIEYAEYILDNEEYYKDTTAANKAFANLEKKLDAAYDILEDYRVTNTKILKATNELVDAIVKAEKYAIETTKATKKALDTLAEKVEFIFDHVGCCYKDDKALEALGDLCYELGAMDLDLEINAAWAVEALEEAIEDLTTIPARASVVLFCEETLEDEKVDKLVESDYTEKTWAKFEKAMAKFEAAETVHEYEDATTAVLDAKADLVKVSTRQAKADFKNALDEAEEAWDDYADAYADGEATDKSLSAMEAFITALEKAWAVESNISSKTVSELEAATAAIEAALEAFENNKVVAPFEGWNYEKGEGWFYYVDGEKATGWLWDADYNSWFYLNEDGTMKTGWHWDAEYNAWYFLNDNGTMATNRWINDNGTWYYVYESGKMAVNTTINGYTVNASGAWVA